VTTWCIGPSRLRRTAVTETVVLFAGVVELALPPVERSAYRPRCGHHRECSDDLVRRRG
jgi:hypothetical protein